MKSPVFFAFLSVALMAQSGGAAPIRSSLVLPSTTVGPAPLPPVRGGAAVAYEKRRLTDARAIQCYLLCGSRLFQQAMRNTLTNVLIYMARDMEITVSQKGSMLAAIATGYFFTQVPGGALADKFGPKNVLVGALLASALCCMAVPIAGDKFGLTGIWFAMCLMGAVQGPMFPTSSVYLSRWMPTASGPGQPDEKAWGTSMLDIGISIGSLLIIPIVTSLAEALGWRNTFFCVGGASLAFVALYMWLGADSPSDCWFISDRELAYLEKHVSGPSSGSSSSSSKSTTLSKQRKSASTETTWIGMPWKMARHPGLWAIFICHIAFNFGAYYLTNWSPTYYKDILNLEPHEAKLHLMLPHMTNLFIRTLNPSLISAVARAGLNLLQSRQLFTVFGYLAASGCLAPVYALRHLSPWVSTVLFSLANACFGLAPTGFKSNYLDVTQKYVGIVAGYGNTLGTVASIVGPKITAATLVRTKGNWYAVLWTVCAVNLVAAWNYGRNAVVQPIENLIEEEEKQKKNKKLKR